MNENFSSFSSDLFIKLALKFSFTEVHIPKWIWSVRDLVEEVGLGEDEKVFSGAGRNAATLWPCLVTTEKPVLVGTSYSPCLRGLELCSSEGKASAYNAGDPSLIPGLGRSPGEGNGNPLQYFCLESPMDGGAW